MSGVRNLELIKSLGSDHIDQLGPRLYETLTDIIAQYQAVAQQVNGNANGQPAPPPTVNSLTVTAKDGHFSGTIQDQNQFYRDIHYHVQFADNPQFKNPQPIHLGPNRNFTKFLGSGTYYWRAASSYSSSPASAFIYHGGSQSPLPVFGGGSVPAPALPVFQGTGTGKASESTIGPGPIPYRSTTGRPPTR